MAPIRTLCITYGSRDGFYSINIEGLRTRAPTPKISNLDFAKIQRKFDFQLGLCKKSMQILLISNLDFAKFQRRKFDFQRGLCKNPALRGCPKQAQTRLILVRFGPFGPICGQTAIWGEIMEGLFAHICLPCCQCNPILWKNPVLRGCPKQAQTGPILIRFGPFGPMCGEDGHLG